MHLIFVQFIVFKFHVKGRHVKILSFSNVGMLKYSQKLTETYFQIHHVVRWKNGCIEGWLGRYMLMEV